MNLYIKKPFGTAGGRQNFFWQKIIAGGIILAACIILLNMYQGQVRNYVYSVSYPLTKNFWQAGNNSSNFIASFLNAGGFKRESNELKQENEELLSQISLLQSELARIQAVSQMHQSAQEHNFSTVLAQTISLDTANDFILIDKGSDHGIRENMPVVSPQQVLYAKVTPVSENFSPVILISNKNSTLDIKINSLEPVVSSDQVEGSSPAPIYGAVKGNGKLSLYLDLVSSDVKISEGDVLVSSALEGTFPRDLLIGKIISKDQSDIKPFQTAEVQPFFDIKSIDNLFVITNYLEK